MSNAKLTVLSMGWGVQSFTLAAMAANGDLEKPDYIIHADTNYERTGTYLFAEKMTPFLEGKGMDVVTVRDVKATSGNGSHEWNGTFIPAFTLDGSGNQGQLRRQCTHRWKIAPVRRAISEILSLMDLPKSSGIVDQWLGISMDEVVRAKDSDAKYISHVFPLLENKMSRADCVGYLQRNGLPIPEPSSCTFCPYHSKSAWRKMKDEGGSDWNQAVLVDDHLRNQRPPYPLFVHPSRVPLSEAVHTAKDMGYAQSDMFDVEDAECDSGYCFM